jgi:hypothetical protein
MAIRTLLFQSYNPNLNDAYSKKREENINKLREILPNFGRLSEIEAKHNSPIENVRQTVDFIRSQNLGRAPRIMLDASSPRSIHSNS